MDIAIGLFGGLAASLVASFVFAFDDSTPFPVSLALGRLLGETAENYYVGFFGLSRTGYRPVLPTSTRSQSCW